jgi:hypothetical protein
MTRPKRVDPETVGIGRAAPFNRVPKRHKAAIRRQLRRRELSRVVINVSGYE